MRRPNSTHPTSRQWRNPSAPEQQRFTRNRQRFCPLSPILPANFDLAAHKQALSAAADRAAAAKLAYQMQCMERRQLEQQRPFPIPPPPVGEAFLGRKFSNNMSAVLMERTVFVPSYELRAAPMADWPSKQEMKYEGDDRISTDRLHGRFLGAPRVPGNGTVNWQQRSIILPEWFDWFYPSPHVVDVFVRNRVIGDSEFSEEEGRKAVGRELMGLLGGDEGV